MSDHGYASSATATAAGGFAKFLGLLGLETVKDLLLHPVFDAVWGEGRVAKEKSVQEVRFEMMAFIAEMEDHQAGEALLKMISDRQFRRPRRYGNGDPYKHADEHQLVSTLAMLYKHLGDHDEKDERSELFKELGFLARTNPEAFDVFVVALDNDWLPQWLRRIRDEIQPTIDAADRIVGKPLKGVNDYGESHWSYARPIPPVRNLRQWWWREYRFGNRLHIAIVAVIVIPFFVAIVVHGCKVLL